jgi:hypothetical protein
MAHPSIVPLTLLASILLAASATAAPALPAIGQNDPALTPATPPQIARDRKKMRLVMELTYESGNDGGERGLLIADNTENEVYYGLVGARVVGGEEAVIAGKEVRPDGSRDIWEMGRKSNKRIVRTIFEGELGAADRATIAVIVNEQDNTEREAMKLEYTDLPLQCDQRGKETGLAPVFDGFGEKTRKEIQSGPDNYVSSTAWKAHQVLGAFAATAGRDSLQIVPSREFDTKIVESDRTSATLTLRACGHYTVKLRLEDAAAVPRPASKVFLSEEYDKCGEAVLKVAGKTLAKGQSAEVSVPKRRFDWYCGNTREFTTAPSPTTEVHVRRAASGRDITWRCFYAATPNPDLKW